MKTFTVVIEVSNTEYDVATFQSALQIKLNEIVDDSMVTSVVITEEE